MKLVTLLTDFGTRDWFVAAMKGVIAGIAPRSPILDIGHQIPPGDIRAGAFLLAQATPYFPPKTVHIAVVDPGVGTSRQPIAIQTQHFVFIGPDNGLLLPAASLDGIQSVRAITNPNWALHPVSHTFHGRDLFAPAGAHLAAGRQFTKIGPRLRDWIGFSEPAPRRSPNQTSGAILYFDRFGNAITNIPTNDLHPDLSTCRIRIGRRTLRLYDSFQSIPPGRLGALPGSTGCLEIAMNRLSAQNHANLRLGQSVTLHHPTSV